MYFFGWPPFDFDGFTQSFDSGVIGCSPKNGDFSYTITVFNSILVSCLCYGYFNELLLSLFVVTLTEVTNAGNFSSWSICGVYTGKWLVDERSCDLNEGTDCSFYLLENYYRSSPQKSGNYSALNFISYLFLYLTIGFGEKMPKGIITRFCVTFRTNPTFLIASWMT